jgi:hypothetical protein
LRHPGASGRGVGGHHAVSLKPPLGIGTASELFHCLGTSFSWNGASRENGIRGIGRQQRRRLHSQRHTAVDSASDNIRLDMEELQALHTRMDEHARTQSELLRRNALRDHHVAIGTAATPPFDTPYMLTREFVCEQRTKEATTVGSQSTLTLSL